MEVRRLAPIALALAASTVFASVAHGAQSQPLQETQLDQACTAAAGAIEKVVAHASTAQPGTIETTLVVSAPAS